MPGCGCVRYCSQLNGVVPRAMELCGCRTGGMYVCVALPVAERMLCAAAPYAHASRHSAANVSAPRRAVVILSMVFPLYARILAHVSRARVVQPDCRGVRTAVLTSLRCVGSLQITLSTGCTESSNTLTRPSVLKRVHLSTLLFLRPLLIQHLLLHAFLRQPLVHRLKLRKAFLHGSLCSLRCRHVCA